MMKYKKFLLAIAASALLFSCVKEQNLTPGQDLQEEEVPVAGIPVPSSASKGQVIVQFNDEMIDLIESDLAMGLTKTKSSELNSVLDGLGIKSLTRVFPDAGEFEPRHREFGLHKFYTVEFNEATPVTKAITDLNDFPGVISTEPVLKTRMNAVFNDTYFSYQWHYYNAGTMSSKHKKGCDINVVPVWEKFCTGNSDVIVGVVDGGIQYDHPDLADNYYMGKNFTNSGHTYVVAHDHGTHVAGTISAINNNSLGVCGIAGGDKKNGIAGARLISAQIFEDNPSDPDHDYSGGGAQAMVWSCDNGAIISQNSWGYVFDSEDEAMQYNINSIPSLKSAIDYFIENGGKDTNGKQTGAMAGGVVIFAAGNSGWSWDPVGSYDKVIAVGSVGPDFTRAYYSNYGSWVNICAPGGDYQKGNPSALIVSTIPTSQYDYMQGTSMACPHVSGVAALIASHFGGPGFTNEMLKEKLLGGANPDAVSSSYQIGPLVDAYGSFTYNVDPIAPDKVEEFTVSPDLTTLTVQFKVTKDADDGKAKGYKVMIAGAKSNITSIKDFDNIPSTVTYKDVTVGSKNVGDDLTAIFMGLTSGKTYYVAIVAYDEGGLYSELSDVIAAKTTQNMPPDRVTTLTLSAKSNNITAKFKVTADPEDGKANGYIVFLAKTSAELSNINYANIPSTLAHQTLTVGNAAVGDYLSVIFSELDFSQLYYAAVVGYDIQKNYSDLSSISSISSGENNAPVVRLDRTMVNIYDYETATINVTVSDPDGHTFNAGFTPGSAAATFSSNGSGNYTINIDGSKAKAGTYTGTFKATDKYGALGTADFTYTIKPNTPPQKVADLVVTPVSNSLKASFSVTSDEESGKASVYLVMLADNRYTLNMLDYENLPISVRSQLVTVGSRKVGDKIEVDFTDLRFDKTYYVAVVGYDVMKLYSDLSDVVESRTGKNNPPVISFSKEVVDIRAHQSDQVSVTISDPDGHSFDVGNVKVNPNYNNCVSVVQNAKGSYVLNFNGRAAEQRKMQGTITFTATDEYGEVGTASMDYTIQKNNYPEYNGELQNVILHDRGESTTINLSEYFTEPDGETMSFTIEQSERILYINRSGDAITFTALDYGLTTVKITAQDSFGLKTVGEFKILVREETDVVATSYPNPVVKTLNVCTTDEPEQTRIVLVNSVGKVVYSGTSTTSAFDPAQIDMSSCAPGKYSLTVTCKAGTTTKTVVKK